MKLKQICPKCGRKLWLREFWIKQDGTRFTICKECARKQRRDHYNKHEKAPDGIFYHKHFGRIMQHEGYSTRIFWNKDMLDTLKTHFPTTKNSELAEMLGVSQSTMQRKASELGLKKDKEFVSRVWEENRRLAHLVTKIKGNSGQIKKGHTPWNKGLKLKSQNA